MARYKFYLEEPGSKSPTRILFYAHWNGRRLKYPTGCKVLSQHWKGEKQCATGHATTCKACTHPPVSTVDAQGAPVSIVAHKEINDRLAVLRSWAVDIMDQFNRDYKRLPEREELLLALNERDGRAESDAPTELLGFIAKLLEKNAAKTNDRSIAVHPTWHGRNRMALQLLKEYAKGKRVPFTAVDRAFVEGFKNYLTTAKGYATNTVGKYMRAVRMFLNEAADEGRELPRSVMVRGGVKIPEDKDTLKIYLHEQEINDLFNLDLTAHPRLDRARDLFIVGCWTGLRFGDLSRLQPEHIQGDRIRIQTSKTGGTVVVPMHPIVRAILNKYGGQFPPVISNQKLNDYVKDVAQMVPSLQGKIMVPGVKAGVKYEVARVKWELVTTHTARRSFASNWYRKGIPSRTIMAITGHRTESAFMRYIRLGNEEHADIMARSDVFAMPVMKAV